MSQAAISVRGLRKSYGENEAVAGIDSGQLPSWLETVGKVFPLSHLALGLQTTLAPGASGSGLEAGSVIALVVWLAIGIRIAIRRFKWEPQASRA